MLTTQGLLRSCTTTVPYAVYAREHARSAGVRALLAHVREPGAKQHGA